MSSQSPQDTSGRASRLAGLFRNILSGNRLIRSANDAKLFFEAIQVHSASVSTIEGLVTSKNGLEALQTCVRVDLNPAFIKSQTLQFISCLANDQLKVLADGGILHRVLVAIVKPPTLWDALVGVVKTGGLEEEGLRIFSWLCLELLCLPESVDVDLREDIETVTRGGRLINAPCPETRQFGYKIQHLLQLQKSPTTKSGDSYAPGGRHDNDFEEFRQISVYPTTDEFLSAERPFYRRVKEVFETGMPERPAVHLDNMYRLTREDLLGELRSDWQNAQIRKKGKRSALTLRKLWPVGLNLGDYRNRKKCSLAIRCEAGLEQLMNVKPSSRKGWLNDNRNFLRHQAFGALFRGQEIFGFAFIDRDLDALLLSPPVITLQFADDKAFKKALLAFRTVNDIMFTLVDTPVFAYEPVLQRLKEMKELPLCDKLLDPAEAIDDFVPLPLMQKFTNRLAREQSLVVNIQNVSVSEKLTLDYSQQQSLKSALTSKVSCIQGPPGTGKSFIGALATHIILGLTSAKILVITYTNHAVDQFLEDLLDLGIDENTMARLGSKSTPRTAPLLLSAQRSDYRRTKGSWALIDSLRLEASEEGEALEETVKGYLQAQPSFQTIQDYLEFSQDDEKFFLAFVVPDEGNGFRKVGKGGKQVRPDYLYNRWSAGDGPGMFQYHALSHHKQVWDIQPYQRLKLIQKWFSEILREKSESAQELARRYDLTQDQMDDLFNETKVHILRGKRIVACTTTAAAKYSRLISSAGMGVVIVEEAGEIQESHVLTALTPSVKQLLLIGDHKQLRPKINNYNLTVEKGDGYDLNRSLFERLLLQGHPHTTLQKQHRMHPDISVLVKELTYSDLEDGPNTKTREPIRGLEDRVIFVNHSHPEEQTEKIADRRDQSIKSSRENIFEAEMVLKTVRYLAQQGYGTKNMVILTPYLGQLRLVRDILLDEVDPWLSDLDSHDLIQAGQLTQAAASVGKSSLRISTIGKQICLRAVVGVHPIYRYN